MDTMDAICFLHDLCTCSVIEARSFRSVLKQALNTLKVTQGVLEQLFEWYVSECPANYKAAFIGFPLVTNRLPVDVVGRTGVLTAVEWISRGAEEGAALKSVLHQPATVVWKAAIQLGIVEEFIRLFNNLKDRKRLEVVTQWSQLLVTKLADSSGATKNEVMECIRQMESNGVEVKCLLPHTADDTCVPYVPADGNELDNDELEKVHDMARAALMLGDGVLTMAQIMSSFGFGSDPNAPMPRSAIHKFNTLMEKWAADKVREPNLPNTNLLIEFIIRTHSKKIIDTTNVYLCEMLKKLDRRWTNDVQNHVCHLIEKQYEELRPYAVSTVMTSLCKHFDCCSSQFVGFLIDTERIGSAGFCDSVLSRLVENKSVAINHRELLGTLLQGNRHSLFRTMCTLASVIFPLIPKQVSLCYYYYCDKELLDMILKILQDVASDDKVNIETLKKLQTALLFLEPLLTYVLPHSPAKGFVSEMSCEIDRLVCVIVKKVPAFEFKLRLVEVRRRLSL